MTEGVKNVLICVTSFMNAPKRKKIMTFIDLTCFSLIALRQETTFRWSSASLVSFSTEAFEIESSLVRAKVTISYHVKKRTKKLVLRYCATTWNIPPPGKKDNLPPATLNSPATLIHWKPARGTSLFLAGQTRPTSESEI